MPEEVEDCVSSGSAGGRMLKNRFILAEVIMKHQVSCFFTSRRSKISIDRASGGRTINDGRLVVSPRRVAIGLRERVKHPCSTDCTGTV